MARKYLTKKVVTTSVKGFRLGSDGNPEPAEILLAGNYNQEKATKEIRKHHDSNFMVTGVEHGEDTFRVALDDFVTFATAKRDEYAAAEAAEKAEKEAAEKAKVEKAKVAKASKK